MDKINCLVYLYTWAKLEGEFVWIYRTLLEYTWLNQPSYIRVGNTFVNYCSLNKVIDLLFFIWCPINHYASLLQISNAMQMECSQTQWKFMIKISGFFWLMENAPWAIPLQSLNWKENPLGVLSHPTLRLSQRFAPGLSQTHFHSALNIFGFSSEMSLRGFAHRNSTFYFHTLARKNFCAAFVTVQDTPSNLQKCFRSEVYNCIQIGLDELTPGTRDGTKK